MVLNAKTLILHVIVMLIWTAVVLVALVIKRYVRQTFKVYIWLQSLGLVVMILGTVGIEVIAPVVEDTPVSVNHIEHAHVVLGIITMGLALTQPVSGALVLVLYQYFSHSEKEYLKTWYYKLTHLWIGRVVIILLIINTLLGILNFKAEESLWQADEGAFTALIVIYIIVLLFIAAAAIFFERKKRNMKEEERRALLEEEGYYMDNV